MKAAILSLSILTNVGLAYYLMYQDVQGPGAFAPRTVPLAVKAQLSPTELPVTVESAGITPKEHRPIAFAALDEMPTDELLSRLRAANLPEELIRAIITAQVDAGMAARMKEMQATQLAAIPYWKNLPISGGLTAAQNEELDRMRRANAQQVRDLLGPTSPGGLDVITNRARYGELSPDKIEKLKAIDSDYSTMTQAARGRPGPVVPPEVREKLALLESEKQKDIRAVLSPNEYEDYTFRTSPSASTLRSTMRGFAPTEAEFRALFAVQIAFDQQYPVSQGLDVPMMRARSEAQPQLMASLRAALSPDRQAEFEVAIKR